MSDNLTNPNDSEKDNDKSERKLSIDIKSLTSIFSPGRNIPPPSDEVMLKILENADKDSERKHKSTYSDTKKQVLLTIIILLFLIFTFYIFQDKDSILEMLMTSIISFAGGGGAGYFYGQQKK